MTWREHARRFIGTDVDFDLDLGDILIRFYPEQFVQDTGMEGFIEVHASLKHPGDACAGSVFWKKPDGQRPIWTLVSRNPLHLEPSILCTYCGNHGFIREGRWVSC